MNDEAHYKMYLPNGSTISFEIDQVNWHIPSDIDTAYFSIKEMSAFRDITHYFVRESIVTGKHIL